uniref:Uncharacterized protein n=1 Tax=viral metagenome TaxID=1070528 RepID=A0A6M3JVZ9_9ZZZZ
MALLSRKELLMEEKDQKVVDPDRANKAITIGGALQSMMETYGWKIVYEEFILPNSEESRFLDSSREDLADIRAEIRVLRRLLKFIDTRVKSASDMVEKIKK